MKILKSVFILLAIIPISLVLCGCTSQKIKREVAPSVYVISGSEKQLLNDGNLWLNLETIHNDPELLEDIMYANGKEIVSELIKLLQAVCDAGYCLEAILPSPKEAKRALAKAMHDYDGNITRLTDIFRCSIISKDIEQAKKALQFICNSAEIIEVKDKLDNSLPNGMRYALIKIRIKDKIVEVQIHLSAHFKVKDLEHIIYEVKRQAEICELNSKKQERAVLDNVINKATESSKYIFQLADSSLQNSAILDMSVVRKVVVRFLDFCLNKHNACLDQTLKEIHEKYRLSLSDS